VATPDLAANGDPSVTPSSDDLASTDLASTDLASIVSASTVLVTGCSSGFGLLTAVEFARHGHHVVASMRDTAKAESLLEAAATAGVAVEVAELDVRSTTSVGRAVDAIVESTGRIDVVVNNAGIELFGAVHLVSDDEATRQLDTNVVGIVRVVRAAVPHMVRQGHGVIVNVGSVAGKVGVPYSGLYAASKHAVEALTEAMHFELAHLGIRVAVVEPGQFATGLSGNSAVAVAMPEDSGEFLRWQSFRGRMRQLVGGEPADAQLVAEVIYEAATSTEPRLRWPVGDDAALVLDAKAALSFEDFESAMRTTLDWRE
jgi:NAD(P)-dependent dehydrogenase (short-subunit alcohol dehydrogenase family)